MKNNYSIDDIVISSRIRLARNFKDIPFPARLNDERNFSILKKVFSAVQDLDSFKIYQMKNLSDLSKGVMFEKHLISAKLIENQAFGAVILNANETISVMINEEDHIRQQCILRGFNLDLAFGKLSKIDDAILRNNEIAFENDLGFLTACPSNLGTGIRASAMLFLPALTISNKMHGVFNMVKKLKQTVRGIYGEGSSGEGFIYQISNQTTLGRGEVEIIDDVKQTVLSICALETQERINLLANSKQFLIQECDKGLQKLINSEQVSISDFMYNLGLVKLGVYTDILHIKDKTILDDLMQIAQPNSLQELSGKQLDSKQIDLFRAQYLKKIFKNIILF